MTLSKGQMGTNRDICPLLSRWHLGRDRDKWGHMPIGMSPFVPLSPATKEEMEGRTHEAE